MTLSAGNVLFAYLTSPVNHRGARIKTKDNRLLKLGVNQSED